ncbi:hypothetical protein M9435_005559 [Picochlorum sp. BPE23]|nr:hypothetical protein M9435_005559 [Picochlorum sp. BPE23]
MSSFCGYNYCYFFVILLILHSAVHVGADASSLRVPESCSKLVTDFEAKYRAIRVSPVKGKLKDPFVFFLHVPRTAGKTYGTCFISPGMKPSERCIPGYDTRERYRQSIDGCRYFASHDDLSFLDEVPDKDNVLVVTQLRDPVQRVISAYEFSIQTASNMLDGVDERIDSMPEIKSYDVWPWRYLVPSARDSILNRLQNDSTVGTVPRDETKADSKSDQKLPTDHGTNESIKDDLLPPPNPYDNELAMPLEEWIETQEASDLVHNGHIFQILGISNTSSWDEAGALRACFMHDDASRNRLFDLAVEKLKQIPHAGLESKLSDAVASMAASLGKKMDDTVYRSVAIKWYFFDDRDKIPDLNMKITYNSTIEGDEHKTVSLREARWRLNKMTKEQGKAAHQLKENEEHLQKLIQQQDMWLATYDAGQDLQEIRKKSPFLQQINKVKGLVDLLRNNNKMMTHDMEILKNNDIVKGKAFGPNTKAFLAWRDEDAIFSKQTLGSNYAECSSQSYTGEKEKSPSIFARMRTKDGDDFQFNSRARRKIDKRIIERIQELNSMDYKLLEIATKVFDEALEKQRSLGILEPVPEYEGESSASQPQTTTPMHDPTEL